jgi:hypothetical protein
MIGSDWPVCLVAASYGEVIDLVRDAIAEYSADEQEQMLGGTAKDFFHLKVEATRNTLDATRNTAEATRNQKGAEAT